MSKGLYSRGRWISLEEDDDGCWISTPYMINIQSDSLSKDQNYIHKCHTMNDVESAAAIGLLFPDYDSAAAFLSQLSRENANLNDKAEGIEDIGEGIYCPICDHCGEVGCCGIHWFIECHLKGKTGCLHGDAILEEIEEIYNDYDRMYKDYHRMKGLFDTETKKIQEADRKATELTPKDPYIHSSWPDDFKFPSNIPSEYPWPDWKNPETDYTYFMKEKQNDESR